MGRRSAHGAAIAVPALLICLCAGTRAYGINEIADLERIERAFVELADRVSPSVVAIETKLDIDPRAFVDPAAKKIPMLGSGVVIEPDGLILTNDHVIRDADKIYVVVKKGRRYEAEIVARDERSDLAVIRIDAEGMVPAEFGDLGEVRVGQWALAMGNPFGLGRDGRLGLSFGIVSALGKSLRALEDNGKKYYGNLIQTTADINPGNSGGPLFNIYGQVVGINTAIETSSGVSEGLGFAVPISSRTRRIIELLARGEKVEYGFLGVNIVNADDRIRRRIGQANRWGVQVTNVIPDSPAMAAELREDDLILEFDSTFVRDTDHLIRMVGATPVGETVPMVVFRGDQRIVLEVQVAKREPLLVSSQPE